MKHKADDVSGLGGTPRGRPWCATLPAHLLLGLDRDGDTEGANSVRRGCSLVAKAGGYAGLTRTTICCARHSETAPAASSRQGGSGGESGGGHGGTRGDKIMLIAGIRLT